MKTILCTLFCFFCLYSCTSAQIPAVPIKNIKPSEAPFKVTTLIQDIDGVPWAIEPLPDGKLLISLREGKFKRLDPVTKKVENIEGAPEVVAQGQGGLLDVALHPDFKNNKTIYYSYSGKLGSGRTTKLEKAVLQGNRLVNKKEIFIALPAQKTFHHYGSRIVFDNKGHLFLSVGERGQRDLSQDLNTHMGKIVRLNLDGSIPKDNPFVKNSKARPEIWSYGHRNPQGLFYDFKKDELWINEHGPRGGDEINLIKKGANYGWPLATYGREYYGPKITENVTLPNVESPKHVWLPSIAPCDLVYYQADKIPGFKNSFLSGALALEHLNLVKMKNGKSDSEFRYLVELEERIRSIAIINDGDLLLGTDGGMILQLSQK